VKLSNSPKKLRFKCNFPGCGRLFKTKFSMQRHTYIHTNEKQYICMYCGKKFALQQYLTEHTYTHTNNKPYVCGVAGCMKRFRQAGKLSLHRRTHKEWVLKEYDCRVEVDNSYKSIRQNKEKNLNIDLQNENSFLIPDPEAIIKEEPKPTENCALGRDLFRLDSGKTNASANNPLEDQKDDFKELELEFAKPENIWLENMPITQENLNKQKMLDTGDSLINYLKNIESPNISNLRPVLPVPAKCAKKANNLEKTNPPELTELIKLYNKE